VVLSILTLAWQVVALFACSAGVGLVFRFFIPKEFPLLNKVFFSVIGGLLVVVLLPQNLVYLGIPVRISAWLILGAGLLQVWWCRHKLVIWSRAFCANRDIRMLGAVIVATVTLHGVAPVRQGLEWYYGKGHPDYLNYVQIAEFLKEQPYGTGPQEIGLRPWMVSVAGWLKRERIGQSIINAEISVWSGTDAKRGYPGTVIFFLAVLAVCVYVFLRDTGVDSLMASAGALLAGILPVLTLLSLDAFLSQISILFVFPFFACLLRPVHLGPRSFTLFFSLSFAYLISAYSELAPMGFGTLLVGVLFVRRDNLAAKRLIMMSAILLTTLLNVHYLPDLIEFLGRQYQLAAYWASSLDRLMPDIASLRGWSEVVFGGATTPPFGSFLDYGAIVFGVLWLAGVSFLSRRDWSILAAVMSPAILVIVFLITRPHFSYYPIAKITLSMIPLVIGLPFLGLSRLGANQQKIPVGVLKKVCALLIVSGAAAGSARYYQQVLNNEEWLRHFRDPRFEEVCRQLQNTANKRVFLFENDVLLTPWLCYYARHDDVYVDSAFVFPPDLSHLAAFSSVPNLETIDIKVSPDRFIDLKHAPVSSP
jgi:hypothetical protein